MTYLKVILTVIAGLLACVVVLLASPRPTPKPPFPPVDETILDRKITSLELRNTTCAQAVNDLQKATGVPLVVDWSNLDYYRDKKLDIDLHDVSLATACRMIFANAENGGTVDIGVAGKNVVIGDPYHFPLSEMVTRTYSVPDLLTDAIWAREQPPKPAGAGPMTRIQALAELVENAAGQANWQERPNVSGWMQNAGIVPFGDRLVVIQTAYGQRQVADFLFCLRHPEAAR